MWNLSDERGEYFLLARREYNVGRTAGLDIVVEEASVSRAHCVLAVEADGSLAVTDKSKFGTRVNGERLQPNETRFLRDGDTLMCGVLKSLAVRRDDSFAVCLSPGDAGLAEKAAAGGVPIVSQVAGCSHLVLTKTAVQPRLLLALATLRHVVAPSWLEALLARPLASSPWPCEDAHAPALEIGTAQLSPSRRTLLRGCVLCFPSERSWQRLAPVCEAAGADSCLGPGQLPPSLRREGVAFVMPGDDDFGEAVKSRLASLQSLRLPFVTAESIAKAILTCRFDMPVLMEEEVDSIAATPPPTQTPRRPNAAVIASPASAPPANGASPSLAKRPRYNAAPARAALPAAAVATSPAAEVKNQESGGHNFKRFRKQRVPVASKLLSKEEMLVAAGGASQAWTDGVVRAEAVKQEEDKRLAEVWDDSAKPPPTRKKK